MDPVFIDSAGGIVLSYILYRYGFTLYDYVSLSYHMLTRSEPVKSVIPLNIPFMCQNLAGSMDSIMLTFG